MSLSALSDELLLEITKWVGTDDYISGYEFITPQRTKFLAPLALCSRRLHRIANPILYQTFVQTGEQALGAFLRLLMSKPGRGAYVKKFFVSDHSEEEKMNMVDFSRANLVTLGVGPEILDFFQLKNPSWVTDLENGEWQAVVALLLLLLPALEEVNILSYHYIPESGHIETALEYAALQQRSSRSQYSLGNLTSISVVYWDTEMGMSAGALLPFCALSSVRKARIHMCSEQWFPPFPQRYPNIQDLHIDNSNIGSEALINILRTFPSLKSLYYENGGANVGHEDFLPQHLGRAISHLRQTLEELTALDSEHNIFGVVEDPGPIGSLACFKKLRKIETCYDVLLIPDPERDGEKPKLINILPSSLEQLAVGQCAPDILSEVRDLLDQKSSSPDNFPRLKEIVIGFVAPADSPDLAEQLKVMKEEGKELAAYGKAMGIEIRILHPEYWTGISEGDFDRRPLWT